MKTKTTLTVRSYELDGYNHVNNANYLHYLEVARSDFMDQAGIDFAALTEEGYMLFVTRIDIQYKTSARMGDVLTIETEPVTLKAVQGSFLQKIYLPDGSVSAEATVYWASVKDGKPCRLPEKYRTEGLKPAEQ
ncbi:MAG: acyl-CoA thioesterase [Treponemataceae bacterium]|nr:acyl-CoA thioesterase [Treponemataceae bacterium]